MIETKIYVGLNDVDTKEQRYDTERYVNLLKKVCLNYGVGFSFSLSEGGYIHDDGTFTMEQSIEISLLDADPKVVDEMARDLCIFFHQESVLITKGEVESYFLYEEL